jgi:peptidase E
MSLILTSDFPSTAHPTVVEHIKALGQQLRIAWIAPDTEGGHLHFDSARDRFGQLGFDHVEYCDIDQERDDVQLAYLYEFDVIYLSGGDPLRFRFNMLRAGLGGRLRQCLAAGRLIVAASGGALLLTPNVSVYRLQSESLEHVLATRGRFDAVGAVPYEFLPHVNRHDAAFLEKVRAYSAHIDVDIIAVPDGGALIHQAPETFEAVGRITRFRRGAPCG